MQSFPLRKTLSGVLQPPRGVLCRGVQAWQTLARPGGVLGPPRSGGHRLATPGRRAAMEV